jgi:hypothetical protein
MQPLSSNPTHDKIAMIAIVVLCLLFGLAKIIFEKRED